MKRDGFLNWGELQEAKRLIRELSHRLSNEDMELKGKLLGRLATVAYDQFYLIQEPSSHSWVYGEVVRGIDGLLFLKTRDSDHESVEHYGYEDPLGVLSDDWIGEVVSAKVCNSINSAPIGPIIFAEVINHG